MEVEITPKVLEWAFNQYAHKDYNSIIKRFPQYDNWINQTKKPTIKQLQDVAKFTGVPFGFLILDHIPPIKFSPIKDFRTLKNRELHGDEYSTELRDTIQTMRSRMEWLHHYRIDHDYDKLSLVGSITQDMTDNEVVEKICNTLKVERNWFQLVKKEDKALNYFSEKIEESGISIFINGIVGNNVHRKLNVKEFRGFALVDDYAPIIFINGADKIHGKLFTLLHEVIHIFSGNDGLDDGSEVFCNRIAALILVPKEAFKEAWNSIPENYSQLANMFHVSLGVIYRCALTNDFISFKEWEKLNSSFENNFKTENKSSSGNFYNNLPYRIGKNYSKIVFTAVQEGSLLYKEAYDLLGIYGKVFTDAMNRAMKKVEYYK